MHFCYCYCRTLLEDTNFDFFQFYKLMFCHRMYSGSMLNDFVCRNRSSFPHRSSRQLNNKYAQLQQYTFSHSSISRTIYIIFLCSVPYSAATLRATYPIYSDHRHRRRRHISHHDINFLQFTDQTSPATVHTGPSRCDQFEIDRMIHIYIVHSFSKMDSH